MVGVKEEEQIARVGTLRAGLTPSPFSALPHTPLHFSRAMQEKGSVVGSCSGAELPSPCPAAAQR